MEIGFLLYISVIQSQEAPSGLHFTSGFEERKVLDPVDHRFSSLCRAMGPDVGVRARIRKRVLQIRHPSLEFQESLKLHSTTKFTLLEIWISAYEPT
jgi:hypothetical protein